MMKRALIRKTLVTCICMFALGAAAQEPDMSDWFPWKDPDNPNVILLDGGDPSTHGWSARRDTGDDAKREPGLFNPQRYQAGLIAMGGFPTFMGVPIAMTTEDLKAGGVDVAFVGLTVDDNLIAGGRYAANHMRTLTDYTTFGTSSYDPTMHVDYGESLVLADYGNVASNYGHNQRSLEEIFRVIGEILDADAIPFAIGGSHIQMYGIMTALAKKHGKGSFAIVHIDAHYDAMSSAFGGRFVHNGSMIYRAVELGIVNGEDIVQVGLRAMKPGAEDRAWMMENGLKFHYQSEINTKGWDTVLRSILEEVKGKKVLISFDMDGLDPAYAPAVGTQEPEGLTSSQGMQLMRAVAIQNELVGAEFLEYNPLLDDAHQTTGILMDRLMKSALAGMAARKKGITDPLYVAPQGLDHK